MWVGGSSPKPDRRTHYSIHAHVRAREARTGVGVRDGAPYCPRIGGVQGGWSDGGKRDRERIRAETGERSGALSSSLSLSPFPPPFVPLADRARGTRSFFTFKNHDDAHFSDS